jgi:outer membrane protein insertion porin family
MRRNCMNNSTIRRLFFLLFLLTSFSLSADQSLENERVKSIDIQYQSTDPQHTFDKSTVLGRLKTRSGDPFSQVIFDSDLKMLYDEFDRIEPIISQQKDGVAITIKIWPKPRIHSIVWSGNKRYSQKKLQKELGVKPESVFNRAEFSKSFNKVKEFYIKKGYFESQLSYSVEPIPNTNQVDIQIQVSEGPSGHIKKVVLVGFTKEERNAILQMINTKKYNFLTSWLTGKGIYHEEMMDQDRTTIINFLHNKGYADAKVDLKVAQDPDSDKIIVRIEASRGQLYHFGVVTYDGNTLFSDEEILRHFQIHPKDPYSPDEMRDTAQSIKDLYGQKGYIEADVQYETKYNENEPIINVDFTIDEGQQYRIGLIRVFGNTSTHTNVILRESLLVPGELFDSRKLKATQTRLESVGYFKTVNVYAVKSNDDMSLGPNYRDVYIEVEETMTGSVSVFLGFSSVDDIFGGLDLTERNFNIRGLGYMFSDFSKLRGGGEYLHARASLGKKQTNYLISWMDPYFRDSLWRIGFELSRTTSSLQSEDYDIITDGFSVFTSYPITNYWTYGNKYRFRYTKTDISQDAGADAQKFQNSGILSAIGATISYDSTDSAYKPHRGFRSAFEAEFSGLGGKFIFMKFAYLNTLYTPLWKKGVMKYRAEVRTIQPFGAPSHRVPFSERFFLGGEGTVRGYKPFILGKKSSSGDPLGGLTSVLLSIEYCQEIFKMLDIFAFADAGSVGQTSYHMNKLRASVGGGVRVEIMNKSPIVVGWGYPINAKKGDKQKFFFSMGGQF